MTYCPRARRRAIVAVQVALTLPVLFGMAIITVDAGALYNARTDMQRAADAAALASVAEFVSPTGNGDLAAAVAAAAESYVELNPVLGQTLSLDPSTDIILGRAYFDANANTYNFVAGDAPTNAVRIVVRHSADSPNGPLPLFFAGVFGKTATDVSASAVAMFVPTCAQEVDCHTVAPDGSTVMCHYGDADDSDDSQNGDSGESGGDADDSDDSDAPFGGIGGSDSEGRADSGDSDGGETILVDDNAVPLFEGKGDTLGACAGCGQGDSDDSDDSQGEFGPPDSVDSDDSDPSGTDDTHNDTNNGQPKVTICHVPPGNPGNAHTITVAAPAVPAHLAHGDSLGACIDEVCAGSMRMFLIQ